MYRVYNKRTDETLFEAANNIDCALWMGEKIDVDSDGFEHVWIEEINTQSDRNVHFTFTHQSYVTY